MEEYPQRFSRGRDRSNGNDICQQKHDNEYGMCTWKGMQEPTWSEDPLGQDEMCVEGTSVITLRDFTSVPGASR